MFENLFSQTQIKKKPKTGNMFAGIFDIKKQEVKKEEPEFRTVSLPEHLGGGEYKTAGPGTLQKISRAYADMDTKEQHERDHIISVALGGTSSKANLQYLKTTEAGRQEGKVSVEQKAINDYLDNKISLPEARAKIAHKQQQIKDLIPKQGVKSYLWEGFKDIFKSKLSIEIKKEQPIEKKEVIAEQPKTKFFQDVIVAGKKKNLFDYFVEEFGEGVKKVQEKLEPIKKFLTPENKEEAIKMGMIPVDDGQYIDIVGSILPMTTISSRGKVAFDKIMKKGKPVFQKMAKKVLGKLVGETDVKKIQALENTLKNLSKDKMVKLPQIKPKAITKAEGLKAIPDELAVEARKFKSVEEFVEAQGKTLYHGTSEKSALKISKEGFKFGKGVAGAEQPITKRLVGDVIYFSENPKVAKSFASGRLDFLVEPKLIKIKTSNLKIAKLNDIPENLLGIERINFLKRKRFDGLKTGADDIAIWNIDKIKTKSQLTDIYNQATKAVKEIGEEVAGKIKPVSRIAKTEVEAIAKRFTPQERQGMEEFIDVVRGVKKVSQTEKYNIKETAQIIADNFRMSERMATDKKLANAFDVLLTEQYSEFSKLLKNQIGFAKIPKFMERSAKSIAPIKHQDETVKTIFKKWTRKLLIGEQKADDAIKNIPKVSDNFNTVLNYEAGIKTKLTNVIKRQFDTLYKKAEELGVKVKYRQNYVPHIYQNTTEEVQQAMAKFMKDKGVAKELVDKYVRNIIELPEAVSKRLKLNPFFSKERAFPDYKTAMEYGLIPKYKEPAQLLSHYVMELEKTVANKDFINSLAKSGRLREVAKAGSDWVAVNLPFSTKGYYAEPKLAKMLNGIFRNEEMLGATQTGIKAISTVAKTMQEIVLSAGIPKTNVNFFAIGMGLVKEITAGNLKSIVNFVKSNFNKATIKHFAKNKEYLTMMAKQGVDMSNTIASHKKIYTKLGDIKGLNKKLGFIWDKTFQEKTFNSLMPMNYLDTFKSTYKRALKKMSTEQAEKLAGDTVRAYHGLYESVGRGKGTEDVLSAVFFAPKFREGLVLTLFNTAKSITTEIFNPAFRKNRQLIAGMITTFAGYNALNKKLTGHYMWGNPAGKEFELMIPTKEGAEEDDVIYVPFMPSFLAFPRNMISGGIATIKGDVSTAVQKFGGLMSMPLKLGAELFANKDYFGREIYDAEAGAKTVMKQMAGYVFGFNEKGASGGINHPFIRETYNQIFTEKALYQSVSEALEIPLKFSTMTKIQQQEFYRALDKKAKEVKETKEKFRPVYDEIQTKIEIGDEKSAMKQLENLTDEEYILYKSLSRADKTYDNRKTEAKIFRQYETIIELRDTNSEEAQQILDSFTDEEYEAYKRLKKKFKK